MANKGDWVQVHLISLTAEQRAPQVPEDTKKVPLEVWVKGYLQEDAKLGNEVTVKTVTGRLVEGKLVDEAPTFTHSFGNLVPEILEMDRMMRRELFGKEL